MMPSLSASSPPASVASVAPAPPVPEVEAVPAAPSPPVPSAPPVRAWRPWRFALVTVATLLTLAATASLGQWQRSRAEQKIALQAGIEAQQLLPPLDQDEFLALGDPAPVLHRPVRLRGLWLGPQTTYLDNRQMHGKPGFFVVTPLQLENATTAVLVQRGWTPRNFVDRAVVPVVPTPSGVVELEGRIAPPPSKLYEFAESPTGAIRQNLDLEPFSREIGRPLAAVSVLQSGPPGEGLLRDWPRLNVGVEKHYGYAFQWFALGGLIALLYGWFQIVKRFILPR